MERINLHLTVILKTRQQEELAFERELKAVEAAPARKGVPATIMETSVIVIDDEDNKKSVFIL